MIEDIIHHGIIGKSGTKYFFSIERIGNRSLDSLVPLGKQVMFILTKDTEKGKPIFMGMFLKPPKPKEFSELLHCRNSIQEGDTHILFSTEFPDDQFNIIRNDVSDGDSFDFLYYLTYFTMGL